MEEDLVVVLEEFFAPRTSVQLDSNILEKIKDELIECGELEIFLELIEELKILEAEENDWLATFKVIYLECLAASTFEESPIKGRISPIENCSFIVIGLNSKLEEFIPKREWNEIAQLKGNKFKLSPELTKLGRCT
jgi:hypothetical protein